MVGREWEAGLRREDFRPLEPGSETTASPSSEPQALVPTGYK